MDFAQSVPGTTSRGAIQQRTWAASSRAQIASAVALSFLEWLMKTSNGMISSRFYRVF
jgi:hypothetical protein